MVWSQTSTPAVLAQARRSPGEGREDHVGQKSAASTRCRPRNTVPPSMRIFIYILLFSTLEERQTTMKT